MPDVPRLVEARGSSSLEFALTVPVLFVLVVVVLHSAVFVRDAVLVQHAAHEGARVAATTTSDRAVRAAVTAALDGRVGEVTITPSPRRAGDTVVVVVVHHSVAGPVGVDVRGRAATRVEPVVGR